MKRLRALEAAVIRIEGIVAVALVLTMLALAGYNVFYRNVLVRLQKHWAHSGPPVTLAAAEPTTPVAKGGDAKTPAPTKGAAEGFGGDWGEDDGGDDDGADSEGGDAKAEPTPAPKPAAEGFGGDWGEDEGGDEPPDAKDEAKVAKADPDELEEAEEDDPFANLPMIDAAGEKRDESDEPLGGPPPPGSFAANAVAFIDRIKLPWIDVVLRQMVILVSFFGAMMATQRFKHINVDALSKLLDRRWRRIIGVLTNSLALFVCVVLARAGADLVEISRAHPNELTPWADDWTFQLMFPIGFGLVGFHFVIRLLEALAGQLPEEGAH
jgi:TRAP-type C4-dicarboxylate transport system permease small subunit